MQYSSLPSGDCIEGAADCKRHKLSQMSGMRHCISPTNPRILLYSSRQILKITTIKHQWANIYIWMFQSVPVSVPVPVVASLLRKWQVRKLLICMPPWGYCWPFTCQIFPQHSFRQSGDCLEDSADCKRHNSFLKRLACDITQISPTTLQYFRAHAPGNATLGSSRIH